uniref:Neurofilament medium polypeptide n=1 Tax=Cacopsylla melanoneura TaxID=428564 RepID=A0A8D8UAQ2_9HEMI
MFFYGGCWRLSCLTNQLDGVQLKGIFFYSRTLDIKPKQTLATSVQQRTLKSQVVNSVFGTDVYKTPLTHQIIDDYENPNSPFNPNNPLSPYNPHSPLNPSNSISPFNPSSLYNPNHPDSPFNPKSIYNPDHPNSPFNPHSIYNPNNPDSPLNPMTDY